VYWYWVRAIFASTVRSCTGCRYTVIPWTSASRACSRAMISVTSASRSSRDTSEIESRPLFWVGLLPSAPMNDEIVATSGSPSTASAARCWSSIILANDTSGAASVTPTIIPVSSTGKNPLGTWSASSTVPPSVAIVTISVVRWWRSTTFSVRS